MEEPTKVVQPEETHDHSSMPIQVEQPGVVMTEVPKAKPEHESKKAKAQKSFNLQSMVIPLLIAFLFISGYLVYEITGVDQKTSEINKRVTALEQPSKYVNSQVEKDKFQAVFLSNGQVYFGKINHIDESTMTLNDIYYLKSGTFKQDGTVSGTLALAKLGKDEVHAPEDAMNIDRNNVEFWENLKNDGQITKAIIAFEKTQNK